ncbi:MAG: hypothetical protein HC904_04515 [Blastochloris sp.]|nr:hypothetical protein [Blastochloris sp.]
MKASTALLSLLWMPVFISQVQAGGWFKASLYEPVSQIEFTSVVINSEQWIFFTPRPLPPHHRQVNLLHLCQIHGKSGWF